MIVVTVHLKSALGREHDRKLAAVFIANDGTGGGRSSRTGNYDVAASLDGKKIREARVEGFPRKSRSALELLRRALNALHEKRELP